MDYGKTTVELIENLLDRGIKRMSVLMRHSARHYDPDHPEKEPFMLLTEEGKGYAYELGRSLPQGMTLRMFSSNVGRCIETSYLIDKGYCVAGGKTEHNRFERQLAPAYVKRPFELVGFMQELKDSFVRHWFEGKIPSELIEPPEKAANVIVSRLSEMLNQTPDFHLNLCVSHDWNLYLVKEQLMGLRHEEVGKVQYLEAVAVYQDQGKTYLVGHQSSPVELS